MLPCTKHLLQLTPVLAALTVTELGQSVVNLADALLTLLLRGVATSLSWQRTAAGLGFSNGFTEPSCVILAPSGLRKSYPELT